MAGHGQAHLGEFRVGELGELPLRRCRVHGRAGLLFPAPVPYRAGHATRVLPDGATVANSQVSRLGLRVYPYGLRPIQYT